MKSYLLVLLLAIFQYASGLGVLSFDLGTEWLKIGLVKRGVAADIALNSESKRKTPVALFLDENERLFGNPAKSAGLRNPKAFFEGLTKILGQKFDHPLVKDYKKQYPYHDLVRTERDTVAFTTGLGVFSVEELLAMVLEKAKEIGSTFAREPINEVVITVPVFWAQAERKSLLYAADLVGLNVLQLMDDSVAVAYSYGVFNQRLFEEKPLTVLFYDQGAGKTEATVVEFSFNTETKAKQKTPQLKIKGTAFDRTLGSSSIDLRLRDHLEKLFEIQNNGKYDVRNSPRAMAKLLKEAERVKIILSANTDTYAEIEGLLPNVDFRRTRVTRQELDDLCADLLDRAAQPMADVLASVGGSIAEIDNIVMFGGGSRVPKIHQKLRELSDGKELSKSINADEAAAIGAVLRAASHSKGFRVLDFHVQDSVLYPIKVTYPKATGTEQAGKYVNMALYNTKGKYPESKLLGFNRHVDDFDFTVSYGDVDFLRKSQKDLLGSHDIFRVEVKGVADAIEKNAKLEYLGTKVRFSVDYSGVLKIDGANATFNIPPTLAGKVFGKLSDMLGLQNEEEVEEGNMAANETAENGAKNDGQNSTADKSSEGEEKKEGESTNEKEPSVSKNETEIASPGKAGNKVKKVELSFDVTALDLTLPGEEAVLASKKRLAFLTNEENKRLLTMEARNLLESTVYSTQDTLENEDVLAVATTDELHKAKDYLSKCSDWLYDAGIEATIDLYKERLAMIGSLIQPLNKRVEEMLGRPAAIEELRKAFKRLERLAKRPEDERFFTAEEYDKVVKLAEEQQAWLKEKLEAQEKLAASDEPALLVADLHQKARRLAREIKLLADKRPPPPPPPKANDTDNITGQNTTTGTDKSGSATDESAKDTVTGSDSNAQSTATTGPDGQRQDQAKDEL